MGSEATAAGGGRKEASEWQRSADDEAALSARKMPGTATGEHFRANAQNEAFCCCQYRTHHFAKVFTLKLLYGIMRYNEVKGMKKIFSIVLILALTLTGCVGLAPDGPETLKTNEKTLKTRFYGTLFPNEFELTGETLEIKNIKLNKISHDSFDLYHADIGSYIEGTIYCEENDYQNALSFYNDPQNYSYFCILGVNSVTQSTTTVEFSDIDTDKFNALLEFADKSNYEPFDKKHNAKIEKVELPMPDDTKDTRLVFYKESNDNLFNSSKGTDYYILNNHLYAVYQYDYGHGEYEKLIAVKVPDDISTYFVEYMKSYL